jgi:S1-C subfamily serine protease
MRLGLRVREGVFVAAVQSGSPADRGGIRAGDVLLSLDGKKIATPEALRQEVSKISPGTSIAVRLYRDQRERTVQISVGAPPREAV